MNSEDVFMLPMKVYEMLFISRPYKTEIRICHCERQECKGRFLVKVESTQTVCLYELRRITYDKKTRTIK